MSDFVHLHNHTEYSLLDGLSKIPKLINYCKENDMDAMAITDHGVMYGAINFYLKFKEAGLKPIIGCEVYVAQRSRKDKEKNLDDEPSHLVLLAENFEGYKNLMELVTLAELEGFYYKPRIDYEILEKYHRGLIGLSACLKGEIPRLLKNSEYDAAKKISDKLSNILGADHFYLEIQDHPKIPEQNIVNKELVKLSKDMGLPIVAANDNHYVAPDDAEAQEALLCIQTQRFLNEKNRPLSMIDSPDFYVKTPSEMKAAFLEYPDAILNTKRISEMINLEIPTGKWVLPKFPIPTNMTENEYLEKIAFSNYKQKFREEKQEEIERIKYELDIIAAKGYSTYFLIVADFANWARSNGIIATTRGSAAGSFVSYLLGITTVNPLEYNLPFERFLTKDRPLPPDIDIDFADLRRDEVIDYVRKKYGEDKVGQIITFSVMEAKQAIRDVGRVMGLPYSKPDKISKLIPAGAQGFPVNIQKAIELTPELQELYNSDPETKRLLDLAQKTEGVARHASVHAAGVVISPESLTHYTPLQKDVNEGKIITQYDMYAIEPLGLLKMDFLGIRNLSILGRAVEIIKEQNDVDINLQKLPLDNKKAYDMLSRGETMGVFQLGGSGMTRYLKELKPTSISDLAAMVALFRPGPMNSIPEFIARKHNKKLIKYLDPRMETILDKSYGVITYQDDVLMIAVEIAGYTWAEADKLRKAMGKKILSEMEKQREKFIKGAINKGMSPEKAEELWHLIEPFAGYGFNKSHAVAYGLVAYQTAYVKALYPVEFMTALLTSESVGTSGPARDEKISRAVNECRKMKIPVLRPDINLSESGFKIEKIDGKKGIRFGLSAIKNVGEAAIETILENRKQGAFQSITDFSMRIDLQKVNKKTFESLIKSGAFDSFGKRSALLSVLQNIIEESHKLKKDISSGQETLFGGEDRKALSISLPNIPEFLKQELLSFEKEFLGFYLSEHPLSSVLNKINSLITIKIGEITPEESIGKSVKIGGIITSVRKTVTKNGNNEMAFVRLEDDTGTIEVVVFPRIYQETKNLWNPESALLISGKVDARDERLSVILESANDLKSTELNEPKIINLPENISPAVLSSLNNLLRGNSGNDTIDLVFKGGKKIRVPFKSDLNSALEEKIKNLLG